MLNLTLSDLIALRQLCHEESMAFKKYDTVDVDYKKWHDRFKQVDKELSDRVEKIFEGNG